MGWLSFLSRILFLLSMHARYWYREALFSSTLLERPTDWGWASVTVTIIISYFVRLPVWLVFTYYGFQQLALSRCRFPIHFPRLTPENSFFRISVFQFLQISFSRRHQNNGSSDSIVASFFHRCSHSNMGGVLLLPSSNHVEYHGMFSLHFQVPPVRAAIA